MIYTESLNKSELPHQQRVITEVNELTCKLNALTDFFDTPIFKRLDLKEQNRLIKQHFVMEIYWGILHDRINNF